MKSQEIVSIRDGFFNLLMKLAEMGVFSLAYADDLTLMVRAQSENLIKKKLDKALACINDWCQRAELKVSAEKTQVLNVGTSKYTIPIVIEGKTVESSDSLTYLGVTISKEMKWREHLASLKIKAERYQRVFQLMLFMYGDLDFTARRRIYKQVFVPAITYGCRVWAKDLKFAYQLKALRRLQRSALLCLARAYHTTSFEKLKKLFNVEDIVTTVKAMCGQPTDANGEERLEVDYGQLRSRELVWFITGHGPFAVYLFRFNLADEDTCRFCYEERETPEHLLFDCRRFEQQPTNELRELEAKARYITIEIFKLSN